MAEEKVPLHHFVYIRTQKNPAGWIVWDEEKRLGRLSRTCIPQQEENHKREHIKNVERILQMEGAAQDADDEGKKLNSDNKATFGIKDPNDPIVKSGNNQSHKCVPQSAKQVRLWANKI